MLVTNRQLHHSTDWQAYRAIPGNSFSDLMERKHPVPETPTAPMLLGTRVHNYILTPERYDWHQPEIVKPLARKLLSIPGMATLLTLAECEIPSTATFEYHGFRLNWKGIPDLRIPAKLIIDFKITQMPLTRAIQCGGYNFQQNGYCAGTDTPSAMIVAIHPKTHEVSMQYIPTDHRWWEEKCLTHGQPIS